MSIFDNTVFQFFYGTLGVYFFAFIASILHEKLQVSLEFRLKKPYLSRFTGQYDDFKFPIVLLIFPYLTGWLVGNVWARNTGQIVELPRKNLMYCAAAVMIGILTYNIAILETSYPVVIMFKSCSILSAIIVGVCFSRVRDQKLKLGINKLIVGGLVSVGIILFNMFSQEEKGEKGTTFFGLMLLLVSLAADGLLPDFQAEMKSIYKPRPVDLMFQINKWVFFFALGYSLVTLQFWKIAEFFYEHPTVMYDILGISGMNFFVQMFVYYIIQKFKQHVAPFVITIRKIFSVVISIFWFSHSIDVMQWFGVGVVFSAAIFDFVSEKYCHRKPTITPIAVENVAFSEIEDTNHNPDSADHVQLESDLDMRKEVNSPNNSNH